MSTQKKNIELATLVLVWICVIVFAFTALTGVLHMLGFPVGLTDKQLDLLFHSLVLSVVATVMLIFRNTLINPSQSVQTSSDIDFESNEKPQAQASLSKSRSRYWISMILLGVSLLITASAAIFAYTAFQPKDKSFEVMSVSFVPINEVEKVQSKSAGFEAKNPHCASARTATKRVSASEGWKIDVNSISPNIRTSSRSTFSGIKDATEDGFTIAGHVKNNGDCVGALGIRDGRGSVFGSVDYHEYKFVEENGPAERLTVGELISPGESIAVPLPAKGFRATVRLKSKNGLIFDNNPELQTSSSDISNSLPQDVRVTISEDRRTATIVYSEGTH